MAIIANKDQGVRVGVMSPRAVYSRVVQIQVNVTAGVGVTAYCFTAMLGNEIRLLNVQACLFGGSALAAVGGFIYIATGYTEPANANEIITQWDLIMPNQCGGKPGIYWWGENIQFSWNMNRLYSGKERRFAVAISNGFNFLWKGLFWFQFSEG